MTPLLSLTAQQSEPGKWVPGVRAGLSFLPYERSVPAVATGVFLGMQLSYERPAGSRVAWSADYGEVSNTQVFNQTTYTGLLANERIKVTEFKDFSGFSFLRMGANMQPGFLKFGDFRIGFSVHLEALVKLDGGYRRSVYSITYDTDITDTAVFGSTSTGPRTGGGNMPLTAADVSRLLLTGGPQLIYAFPKGPQIAIGALLDGNRRLVGFEAETSRMTFIELAFNYPLF